MAYFDIIFFPGFIKQREVFSPFYVLEWFLSFRFIQSSFFSLAPLSHFPLHSCTSGFHSLLPDVAVLDYEKSKLQADLPTCSMGSMGALDAFKSPQCEL